jgi:hypothetical protein
MRTNDTRVRTITREHHIDERAKTTAKKEQTLVSKSDQAQQRTRSGTEGLPVAQPKENCAFAQTIGRTEPAAQGQTVSIGDVDVEFLH